MGELLKNFVNLFRARRVEVESTSPWIHVSPASGSGNGTITVTVDQNPDVTERTGTIVYHISKGGTVRQAVRQAAATGVLELEMNAATVDPAGSDGTKAGTCGILRFNRTDGTKQYPGVGCLSMDVSSGEAGSFVKLDEEGMFGIVLGANNTDAAREVTVTASYLGQVRTARLTQGIPVAEGTLTLVSPSATVDPAGSDGTNAGVYGILRFDRADGKAEYPGIGHLALSVAGSFTKLNDTGLWGLVVSANRTDAVREIVVSADYKGHHKELLLTQQAAEATGVELVVRSPSTTIPPSGSDGTASGWYGIASLEENGVNTGTLVGIECLSMQVSAGGPGTFTKLNDSGMFGLILGANGTGQTRTVTIMADYDGYHGELALTQEAMQRSLLKVVVNAGQPNAYYALWDSTSYAQMGQEFEVSHRVQGSGVIEASYDAANGLVCDTHHKHIVPVGGTVYLLEIGNNAPMQGTSVKMFTLTEGGMLVNYP